MLNDKQKKNLLRLAEFLDTEGLSILEIIDGLEARIEELKDLAKGEKGDTPIPGVDFPLPKDGEDYVLTEKDKREIAENIEVPIVEKVIEKTEVVREQPIEIIKEVAIPESLEQIIEKINESDEKISIERIAGIEDLEKKIESNGGVRVIGGRAGFQLYLDSEKKGIANTLNLIAGTNISFAYDRASGRNDLTITAQNDATAVWGSITGTLSNQTDLQAALDAKADSLTADQNYVSDAELTVLQATSGTNTGDLTVTDSTEIDFSLTGQDLTASLKTGSIDILKLDSGVQTSLGLADSALQSADIGVSVQAYDADLTTWAGITPGANVGTALAVAVGTDGAFVVKGGALGTPSSGVATNITGLPAASVLAGTFGTGAYVMDTSLTTPLIIGGTGTTSDLVLQSTSGIGASGADIIFKVGNNGATEAMRILNSGYVGIGTDAPAVPLQLHHTSSNTTTTSLTLADLPFAFRNTDTTNGNMSFLSFQDSGGFGIALVGAIHTNQTTHSGELAFYTKTASVGIAERMRINTLGYVGIGTTAPEAPFDVLGMTVGNATYDHTMALRDPTNMAQGVGGVMLFSGEAATGSSAQYYGGYLRAAKTNGTSGDYSFDFVIGTRLTGNAPSESLRITNVKNVKIAGSANRATTEGTNHLDIFDGTAPVGTLTNGISIYSSGGEGYMMDAAGNATLQTPHDKDGYWIYKSTHTPTGKVLKIDMEKMMKAINDKFGWDFVKEYIA